MCCARIVLFASSAAAAVAITINYKSFALASMSRARIKTLSRITTWYTTTPRTRCVHDAREQQEGGEAGVFTSSIIEKTTKINRYCVTTTTTTGTRASFFISVFSGRPPPPLDHTYNGAYLFSNFVL